MKKNEVPLSLPSDYLLFGTACTGITLGAYLLRRDFLRRALGVQRRSPERAVADLVSIVPVSFSQSLSNYILTHPSVAYIILGVSGYVIFKSNIRLWHFISRFFRGFNPNPQDALFEYPSDETFVSDDASVVIDGQIVLNDQNDPWNGDVDSEINKSTSLSPSSLLISSENDDYESFKELSGDESSPQLAADSESSYIDDKKLIVQQLPEIFGDIQLSVPTPTTSSLEKDNVVAAASSSLAFLKKGDNLNNEEVQRALEFLRFIRTMNHTIQGINMRVLLSLHARLSRIHVPAGTVVFNQGQDSSDGMYMIMSGQLGVYLEHDEKSNSNSNRIVHQNDRNQVENRTLLCIFKSSQTVGENVLLAGTSETFTSAAQILSIDCQRPRTCIATTDSVLLKLDRNLFDWFIASHPSGVVSFILTTSTRQWRVALYLLVDFLRLKDAWLASLEPPGFAPAFQFDDLHPVPRVPVLGYSAETRKLDGIDWAQYPASSRIKIDHLKEACSEIVRIAPGSDLYSQGSDGDELYIILSGTGVVHVNKPPKTSGPLIFSPDPANYNRYERYYVDSSKLPSNVGTITRYVGPGSIAGGHACFVGSCYRDTLTATSWLEVAVFKRSLFTNLADSIPLSAENIPSEIVALTTSEETTPLNSGKSQSRILHTLVEISLAVARSFVPLIRIFLSLGLQRSWLKSNEVLFRENDPQDGMYVVISGRLRTLISKPKKQQVDTRPVATASVYGSKLQEIKSASSEDAEANGIGSDSMDEENESDEDDNRDEEDNDDDDNNESEGHGNAISGNVQSKTESLLFRQESDSSLLSELDSSHDWTNQSSNTSFHKPRASIRDATSFLAETDVDAVGLSDTLVRDITNPTRLHVGPSKPKSQQPNTMQPIDASFKDEGPKESLKIDVGRGETVGELSVLTKEPSRLMSAVCIRDCELVKISSAAFELITSHYPAVLSQFMEVLALRYHDLTKQISGGSNNGTLAMHAQTSTLNRSPDSNESVMHPLGQAVSGSLMSFNNFNSKSRKFDSKSSSKPDTMTMDQLLLKAANPFAATFITIAVVPAGGNPASISEFTTKLVEALQSMAEGPVLHLSASKLDTLLGRGTSSRLEQLFIRAKVAAWLSSQEEIYKYIVFEADSETRAGTSNVDESSSLGSTINSSLRMHDTTMLDLAKAGISSLGKITENVSSPVDVLRRVLASSLSSDDSISKSISNQYSQSSTKSGRVSYWSKLCVEQADLTLLVGAAHTDPSLSLVESQVIYRKVRPSSFNANHPTVRSRTFARKELVLLHDEPGRQPSGTRSWLRARPVSWHHHLRTFQSEDYQRIARHICGKARGLVLSGGASRGLGHLGALEILERKGIAIDVIGGTSQGAFMGAAYAMHLSVNQMGPLVRRFAASLGSTWSLMTSLTLPLIAYTSGESFNETIIAAFRDIQIEDLWIRYFCVSTNVTDDSMAVHTTGPLWRYCRASMTVMGLLPPINDNGRLLIDGGYVNNFPVEVLRAIAPQVNRIFAVDVENKDASAFTGVDNVGDSISGWWLAWKSLLSIIGFAKPLKIPPFSELALKLSYISHSIQIRELLEASDDDTLIYIRPDVGTKFKLFDYHRMNEIVSMGRDAALETLNRWEKRQRKKFELSKKKSQKNSGKRSMLVAAEVPPFIKQNSLGAPEF
jgi:predicted acylesterase/phospholipase RssA/CRP-like cAMP-binding protein